MDSGRPLVLLASSLILALGIALAGYFGSQTLYNARVAINTAEAKGLAERRVEADRASWTVRFLVNGKSRDELPAMYERAEEQQRRIVSLLEQAGLEASDITPDVLEYSYQEYRDDSQRVVDQTHTLIGGVSVETERWRSSAPRGRA